MIKISKKNIIQPLLVVEPIPQKSTAKQSDSLERLHRKIQDLEIYNSSLEAVNQNLETKVRQQSLMIERLTVSEHDALDAVVYQIQLLIKQAEQCLDQ